MTMLKINSRILLIIVCLMLPSYKLFAHEPLFGIGPHVLFKGGFAPHFTLSYQDEWETEYALGYGITRNWTVIGETAFGTTDGYRLNRINLKQKYRVLSHFEPGLSRALSAVGSISVPTRSGKSTVAQLGVTGGQEAQHWYWFFSGQYFANFTNQELKPGNTLAYSATLGYRINKVDYYKPDFVFFLEGTGKYIQKSKKDNDLVKASGGQLWQLAPTFMFTYRNVALRGGVQLGIADAGHVDAPDVNYKLTIEMHL